MALKMGINWTDPLNLLWPMPTTFLISSSSFQRTVLSSQSELLTRDVGSEYLVHNMMEEFVDCTVIEIGKLIFEYMQSRSARLVGNEGFNPAQGKGPILLRTTNELKRRLSRETDAAFIGRIMIFISLLLPPWERSGVNLRGSYNVESITKYEELEKDENKMDVDGDEDSTGIFVPSTLLTLDSFYVKFWSLQEYLKNPVILHSQEVLDEFKPKLDFVINKFFGIEKERLRLRGQAINNKSSADQKMDVVVSSEDKSEYYPGFLKSRQLFDLQVRKPVPKFSNRKARRFEIPTHRPLPNYGRNETPALPHSRGKGETRSSNQNT